MDVDLIVAWWLEKCLKGEMTTEDLFAALHELQGDEVQGDVVSARPDAPRRLTALTRQVGEVLAMGDRDQARVESLAVEFLGALPSAVLEARGTTDWHPEG